MTTRPQVNATLRRMRYRSTFTQTRMGATETTLATDAACSTPLAVKSKEYQRVPDLPFKFGLYRAYAVAEDVPSGIEAGDTLTMAVKTARGAEFNQVYTVVASYDEGLHYKIYIEAVQD